jgi:CHAT domain-containing protein
LGGVCEAEGRLTEAHGHYARAVEAIEATRRNVHEEGARTIFPQGKMAAYEGMVRLLHRLHRSAPSAGWDRQALEYAERARARTFLDRLAEARAELRKGMTAGQLKEERRLLREAARIQKLLLRETPDETQRAGQEKELAVAMDRLEAFEDARRRQSPEYAALRRPEPESIEAVQAQLDRREILVEFMLGDGASYAWLVSHRAVHMAVLPGRDRLERQVGRYRALIGRPPTRDGVDESVRLGRALFETLFAGFGAALEGATSLTVVPDGALHYLPFETLIRGLDVGGAPRYLLESHDVTYVPSASALVSLNRRPEGPAARLPLLAYGDPTGPVRARVPLVHARREVESIARLYPPDLRRVRLGSDASERAFKREDLARFRILHLATHGMNDPQVPARSGLVLAPGGADEDGLLQGIEIVNLDLDADLVVLSACGSGLGRLVKGEGLVGVTRAFFYAGARRLVVSLWDVDDQSTATLMESFYRKLQGGRAPAWALRDAKREISRSDRPAHRFPYYWASFVMVGPPKL